MFIGGELFNFIGAVTRWTYGTVWRTLYKRKKYSFKEYLRGPKDSEDWFDMTAHEFNNRVIGALVLFATLFLLLNHKWLFD